MHTFPSGPLTTALPGQTQSLLNLGPHSSPDNSDINIIAKRGCPTRSSAERYRVRNAIPANRAGGPLRLRTAALHLNYVIALPLQERWVDTDPIGGFPSPAWPD